MHSFLYYYLIFINCTAFVVYGADKAFARLHSWRVPEIVLLLLQHSAAAQAHLSPRSFSATRRSI